MRYLPSSIIMGCLLLGTTLCQANESVKFAFEIDDHHIELSGTSDTTLFKRAFDLTDQTSMKVVQVKAERSKRDYDIPLTTTEKECIQNIINTLSKETTWGIATSAPSLQKDGAKIKWIHPFRFFEYTLNSEKLKTGMLAIRQKGGWIWDRYISGIVESLEEESNRNNLEPYLAKFARSIKLDVNLITPLFQQKKWKDFINLLMDSLPRKTNPNRYDM